MAQKDYGEHKAHRSIRCIGNSLDSIYELRSINVLMPSIEIAQNRIVQLMHSLLSAFPTVTVSQRVFELTCQSQNDCIRIYYNCKRQKFLRRSGYLHSGPESYSQRQPASYIKFYMFRWPALQGVGGRSATTISLKCIPGPCCKHFFKITIFGRPKCSQNCPKIA